MRLKIKPTGELILSGRFDPLAGALRLGPVRASSGGGGGVAGIPYKERLNYFFRWDAGAFSDFAGTTLAVNGNHVRRWVDTTGAFVMGLDSTSSPTLDTSAEGIAFSGSQALNFLTYALTARRTGFVVINLNSGATGVGTLVTGVDASLGWRFDTRRPRLVNTNTADIGFAGTTLTQDVWAVAGITFTAQTGAGSFSLNGAADGTVSTTASTTLWPVQTAVGQRPFVGEGLSGTVRALAEFQGVMTSGEIAEVAAWLASTFL